MQEGFACDGAMTVSTALLADHEWTIDALVRLMEGQWSGWYRPGGASARDDLVARLHRDQLPLGIVAFVDGQPVGACALTVSSGGLVTDQTPWLGGLIVATDHRRRGVGSRLLQRAASEANRLGHGTLFALTAEARQLFDHQNWSVLETIALHGEPHSIYATPTA